MAGAIDWPFIRHLSEDGDNEVIVRAIIQMAHSLVDDGSRGHRGLSRSAAMRASSRVTKPRPDRAPFQFQIVGAIYGPSQSRPRGAPDSSAHGHCRATGGLDYLQGAAEALGRGVRVSAAKRLKK